MSIPKVIHYCWFGRNPLTEKAKSCIESWKKICPDYEIVEWNEDNYDITKIPYIEQAYRAGKWAFVSDFARLDIIYNHGGIYLDTDVELIKRPEEFLEESLVLAMEKQNCTINTGLGFMAKKEQTILKELMELYQGVSFVFGDGTYNLKACPKYTTEYFDSKGYEHKDKTQRIGDALILNSEFFCPMDYYTGVVEITDNTIGIHWYEASWFGKGDKEIHMMEQKIRRYFPKGIAKVLCFIYRKSYRLVEYISKGILIDRIKKKRGIRR